MINILLLIKFISTYNKIFFIILKFKFLKIGSISTGVTLTRVYDLSKIPHYFLYFGLEVDISGSWEDEQIIIKENGNNIRSGITYKKNASYMDDL